MLGIPWWAVGMAAVTAWALCMGAAIAWWVSGVCVSLGEILYGAVRRIVR